MSIWCQAKYKALSIFSVYHLNDIRLLHTIIASLLYRIRIILFIHSYVSASSSGIILQAQDVNFAMEASRKSRIAFVAANGSLGEIQQREGIASIKTALDFNFQDVEGLLRLVRLAIEAITR